MGRPASRVVVGLDNGATGKNAAVLDGSGWFLVDRLVEPPSSVPEGSDVAVEALVQALDHIVEQTGTARTSVRAVGLDTPGPPSGQHHLLQGRATNVAQPAGPGFDVRGALEARLDLPVVYNNDANAAALYAHHVHFGPDAGSYSSISAVVGIGLGGGVIEAGRVVRGAVGMAAYLGPCPHPPARPAGRGAAAADQQLRFRRRCLERRLPNWDRKEPAALLADPFKNHELGRVQPVAEAAKLVRD